MKTKQEQAWADLFACNIPPRRWPPLVQVFSVVILGLAAGVGAGFFFFTQ